MNRNDYQPGWGAAWITPRAERMLEGDDLDTIHACIIAEDIRPAPPPLGP